MRCIEVGRLMKQNSRIIMNSLSSAEIKIIKAYNILLLLLQDYVKSNLKDKNNVETKNILK
jgi:hypothetical protein